MKAVTLKNLAHAHAWLGIIISGVLMIVFFCGSMSFFRENIVLWDMQYDAPATEWRAGSPQAPLSQVVQNILAQGYQIPADHGIYIRFPHAKQPFYVSYFESEQSDGDHQDLNQSFDAQTAQRYALDQDDYYLGAMLYRMHINLMLPGGTELVGLVSLLFFVMVLSGLLIILKKVVSHYYQYRLARRKDTYLDGHTIIGISTLPYTLLYALTGVMFNLSILLQAGIGFAVFKGDIPALLKTVDFYAPPKLGELAGVPADLTLIDVAVANAISRYPEQRVQFVNLFAPQDRHGQIEVVLSRDYSFERLTRLTYSAEDASLLKTYTPAQSATAGTYAVLSALHVGNYGGNALKFIYFLLGLAGCYLILTGNLIWLEKREQQRQQSQFGLRLVKALTIALSTGTLSAVGASFITARLAPERFSQEVILPQIFGLVLLLSLLHALQARPARHAMLLQLRVAAVLALVCPCYDLLQWVAGHLPVPYLRLDVVMVSLAQIVVAVFCYLLVRHHRLPSREVDQQLTTAQDAR